MKLSYLAPLIAGLILFLVFFVEPVFIGYIISEGGNVTRVDVRQASSYWQGVYGNISSSGQAKIDLIKNVTAVHLLQLDIQDCAFTEIYASSSSSVDFTNLIPALPSDIDTYLGLPSSSRFSGTSIFTNKSTFDVYNNTYVLNSTIMNSVTGNYEVGILKDGATLVFVTRKVFGLGFTGEPTDYQMMLPVPINQNTTYYFEIDPYDAGICNLTGPSVLTAGLASDNVSIVLRWPQMFADNYSVYFTNNLSDAFNTMADGINILNYTDFTAGTAQQRFYRISYWNTSSETYFNKTVGKYDLPLKYANGNPATYEQNQVSFPIIPNNMSFESILRDSSDGDVVLRFNTTDEGTRFTGWETNIRVGNVWIKQFDKFRIEEGYVFVSVNNPRNLTIIGEPSYGMFGIPMIPITGTPGNYEMMLLGWNTLRTDCDLNFALNTTTPPGVVTWFDTQDLGTQYAGWDTYLLMNNGTWNWFPTTGCMRPGRGYRFLSNGIVRNWEYNRSVT